MTYREAADRIEEHARLHYRREFPHAVRITEALQLAVDVLRERASKDTIGIVLNKEMPCYKHEVRLYPKVRHYENGVVKYTCPVCDAVEDRHQLGYMESKCPICGVNLIWLDKKV